MLTIVQAINAFSEAPSDSLLSILIIYTLLHQCCNHFISEELGPQSTKAVINSEKKHLLITKGRKDPFI